MIVPSAASSAIFDMVMLSTLSPLAARRSPLADPGHELLAASLRRFVGVDGYELPALQADLARFAFLLGDDGEQLFTGDQQ